MDKNTLHNDVNEYLKKVNKENFSKMYDGLSDIIINYNNNGMSKKEIFDVLYKFSDQIQYSLDLNQDEVYCEVFNRLVGFCPPFKVIELR